MNHRHKRDKLAFSKINKNFTVAPRFSTVYLPTYLFTNFSTKLLIVRLSGGCSCGCDEERLSPPYIKIEEKDPGEKQNPGEALPLPYKI